MTRSFRRVFAAEIALALTIIAKSLALDVQRLLSSKFIGKKVLGNIPVPTASTIG